MNDGIYVTVEDRPAVRFERLYGQPAERLWQALADPEQARLWFPSALSLDPRAGGAARFSDDPHMPDSEGTVLEYDAPRAVGFTWGAGEVHIAMEPVGGSSCRFVLTNLLAAADEAARNAAGWDVCLNELDELVRGEDPLGPHAAGEKAWQAAYEVYVQSGMPAGAPVPLLHG